MESRSEAQQYVAVANELDKCIAGKCHCPKWYRRMIAVLLAFCNCSLYLSRANISVAVLYMLDEGNPWQKWILAAFYVGYASFQVLGGYLACRFGGKVVLSSAVTLWTVATLACVPAFNLNKEAPIALILCRVFIGMAEGCNYPSQIVMAAHWFPAEEWTSLWTFVGSGEAIGTIIAMATSPAIATHLGWEAVFYTSAGLGTVWLMLFWWLAAKTPEAHPWISKEERAHIMSTRKRVTSPETAKKDGSTGVFPGSSEQQGLRDIPWGAFLRHRPFLGTVVTHFCYNYQAYLSLSIGPYFFKSKYDVNVSDPHSRIGFYACLPYVVLGLAQPTVGFLSDMLTYRLSVPLTTVRKIANTIGMSSCALFYGLLGAPFIQGGGSHSLALAVALLSAGIGLGGVTPAGYFATYHDMSPRYGGVLLGLGNTVATIPGIVGNLVSGTIVDRIEACPASQSGGEQPCSTSEAHAWSIIFLLVACVSAFGGVVFVCTASSDAVDFDSANAAGRKQPLLVAALAVAEAPPHETKLAKRV